MDNSSIEYEIELATAKELNKTQSRRIYAKPIIEQIATKLSINESEVNEVLLYLDWLEFEINSHYDILDMGMVLLEKYR